LLGSGLEIPLCASAIVRKDWRGKKIRLERDAEMARSNIGSTVILLLPGPVDFKCKVRVEATLA